MERRAEVKRTPVLAARRISKSFNGVQVLFCVQFRPAAGQAKFMRWSAKTVPANPPS